MIAAVDARLVVVGIGLLGVTEQLDVALAGVETIPLLERVPRLMAKDAAAFGLACALAFEHLRSLQPHQAGVHQIEGYCEAQHPLGSEELLRQPHMRKRDDVPGSKLAMETLDSAGHQRAI